MNRNKKIRTGLIAVIVLLAVIAGASRLKIQSVSDYQKEGKQLAQQLQMDEKGSLVSGMPSSGKPEETDSEQTGQSVSDSDKKSQKSDKSSSSKAGKKKSGTVKAAKEADSDAQAARQTPQKKKAPGKTSAADGTAHKKAQTKAPSGTEAGAANTDGNNTSQAETGSQDRAQAAENEEKTSATKKPEPVEAAAPTPSQKAETITCTIQIRCERMLENKDKIREAVWKYVPANGTVLADTIVHIEKGSSAYDLLSQVCKAKGIAVDADYTPMYKSYYVRGIANLYEFDAGEMSGWIYKVNGKAPNKGASAYKLADGDKISWGYTCDGKTS